MIEEFTDLPDGVIGFRVTGKVTREDYERILPRIQEVVEGSGQVRALVEIGPQWEGMTSGAVREDVKTALRYEVLRRAAWKRTAVVTDLDWIERSIDVLGWVVPGEIKVFGPDQLEEAKAWVVA